MERPPGRPPHNNAHAPAFGTCGVRGIAGEALSAQVVDRLALALAVHLGPGRRVCVARDTRPSGPELEEQFVAGLARRGLDVTRLGVITTPALYMLTRELGFDSGVMITASHNPPEYNGFKFCDELGMCPNQQDLERLYLDQPTPAASGAGRVESLDGAALFYARLRELCPPPRRKLRLVVDCACGPHSLHLPDFLRGYGHEVLEYNCVPDVTRCDRDVEPTAETLVKTIAFAQRSDADAGFCFDGDSDRVVFLDREGFVGFQSANALLARIALEEASCPLVIGTVETGRFVEEAVRTAGGRLHRTAVGDIRVAQAVREHRAAVGLEECGHYIFPQVGHFSETVFPAALLIARRDLDGLRRELHHLPPVFAGEKRIECAEGRKGAAMEGVGRAMQSLDGTLDTTDGFRVDWEDGWLLVRPSGTSPYMKTNAEALSEERLAELVGLGLALVREALGE